MGAWTNAQTFVDSDSTAASPAPDQYPLRVVDRAGSAFDTDAYTAALTPLGAGASGSILAIDASPRSRPRLCPFRRDTYRDHVNRSITAALPVLEGFSQRWALSSAERFERPNTASSNDPRSTTGQSPPSPSWPSPCCSSDSDAAITLSTPSAAWARTMPPRGPSPPAKSLLFRRRHRLSSLVDAAPPTLRHQQRQHGRRLDRTRTIQVAATTAQLALTAWSAATRTTTATLDAIKDR